MGDLRPRIDGRRGLQVRARRPDGALLPLKADPFGFEAELRPSTASVVADSADFTWTDAEYMARRARGRAAAQADVDLRGPSRLLAARRGRRLPDLRRTRRQLIPYVADMGFTHIELLPITRASARRILGLSADRPVRADPPLRRSGRLRPLRRSARIAAGLGVILDWVPAHFPTDEHGLAHFDGTALYEHADPRKGFHPDWNTAIYNFGRTRGRQLPRSTTRSTGSSASTSTGCASMRSPRCSTSTIRARRANGCPTRTAATRTSRRSPSCSASTSAVYGAHPGVVTIAEESTAWPGVSRPTDAGRPRLRLQVEHGLDARHAATTCRSEPDLSHAGITTSMTFGLLYAFTRELRAAALPRRGRARQRLARSARCRATTGSRFANARAYLRLHVGLSRQEAPVHGPGVRPDAANGTPTSRLDWWLLDYWPHQGVQALVRDLNRLYRETPALHARDCEPRASAGSSSTTTTQSVFAWLRCGARSDPPVAVVCNFTPVPREGYRVGLPYQGNWREVLNTDAGSYGGSNMGNSAASRPRRNPSHGFPASATLTLPPLATLFLVFSPPAA